MRIESVTIEPAPQSAKAYATKGKPKSGPGPVLKATIAVATVNIADAHGLLVNVVAVSDGRPQSLRSVGVEFLLPAGIVTDQRQKGLILDAVEGNYADWTERKAAAHRAYASLQSWSPNDTKSGNANKRVLSMADFDDEQSGQTEPTEPTETA